MQHTTITAAPLRVEDIDLSRFTSRDLLSLMDSVFGELNGRRIFGETDELDDVFSRAETQVDCFTHECRKYLDGRAGL